MDKIIQMVQYRDCILCLTQTGRIFSFDPETGMFSLISEGIFTL